MNPRYILIDGKPYVWSELMKLRREQLKARVRERQLTLFELKMDARPSTERSAAGRFLEPSLLALMEPTRTR